MRNLKKIKIDNLFHDIESYKLGNTPTSVTFWTSSGSSSAGYTYTTKSFTASSDGVLLSFPRFGYLSSNNYAGFNFKLFINGNEIGTRTLNVGSLSYYFQGVSGYCVDVFNTIPNVLYIKSGDVLTVQLSSTTSTKPFISRTDYSTFYFYSCSVNSANRIDKVKFESKDHNEICPLGRREFSQEIITKQLCDIDSQSLVVTSKNWTAPSDGFLFLNIKPVTTSKASSYTPVYWNSWMIYVNDTRLHNYGNICSFSNISIDTGTSGIYPSTYYYSQPITKINKGDVIKLSGTLTGTMISTNSYWDNIETIFIKMA